jgi:uncharacterized membrane protein
MKKIKKCILFSLGLLVLWSFLLVIFRLHVTWEIRYLFMAWNLFLWMIPTIAVLLYTNLDKHLQHSNILTGIFFCLFLLFFPNASYLVTDLIHLPVENWARSVSLWYDTVILFSFAFTGIMAMFAPLYYWHKRVTCRVNVFTWWFFASLILLLGAYWVFLWRSIRLNSWEVFSSPQEVLVLIQQTLLMQEMYYFTLLFFMMTVIMYFSLFTLTCQNNHKKIWKKDNN